MSSSSFSASSGRGQIQGSLTIVLTCPLTTGCPARATATSHSCPARSDGASTHFSSSRWSRQTLLSSLINTFITMFVVLAIPPHRYTPVYGHMGRIPSRTGPSLCGMNKSCCDNRFARGESPKPEKEVDERRPLLSMRNDHHLQMRRHFIVPIHALRRFPKVRFLGAVDVHECLRIAIDQRKPACSAPAP